MLLALIALSALSALRGMPSRKTVLCKAAEFGATAAEIDAEGGVAVLELHDPQRFNTMGWALGDDMTRSVNHLHQLGGVRAVTLQGAGSTFCAGGNQYNSSGLASLTASSQHLLKSIQVCLLTTCLVVMLLASSPRPHAVVGLCRCACFARAGRMRCARWHGRRRGRDLLAY